MIFVLSLGLSFWEENPPMNLELHKGAFINHVDMAGGGGLPNIHITTQDLLSKMVHKGGRGVKKVQISVHMVYE